MKLVKGDMKKKFKETVITQKKIYIIGVIVFVILIVGFVGWTIYESKNGKEPGQEQGYESGEGGDEGLHAEKEGDGDFIEDPSGSDKKPSSDSKDKDKDKDDNKKEDSNKDDDDIEFGRVF